MILQLIQSVFRIVELLTEILAELKSRNQDLLAAQQHSVSLDDLIDSVKVKNRLDISKSTLYRLKTTKVINTFRIGRRDYYSKSEIEKIADITKSSSHNTHFFESPSGKQHFCSSRVRVS